MAGCPDRLISQTQATVTLWPSMWSGGEVTVTWIWSGYGCFSAFLWRHAVTTLWSHRVTSMQKIWHLWLFCIVSSDRILPESLPYSSGRTFFFRQVCVICDVSASGLVTRFYSNPNRKDRTGIFFFVVVTGLRHFWRFCIESTDQILPKFESRKFGSIPTHTNRSLHPPTCI